MAKVCYFTDVKLFLETTVHTLWTKLNVPLNLTFKKVTILVDGKPKKVWASARALKSGKVERV